MGGGTIVPVRPYGGGINTNRTVISGLDIRGEAQRLRMDSPNNKTVKDIRFILAKIADAVQANADVQDDRFRQLSTSFNSVGLTRDAGGNTVITGATFTVRIGLSQFTLALGGMLFPVAPTAPEDDSIPRSHAQMWLNEGSDELKIRVRKSDGTLKTATIALL